MTKNIKNYKNQINFISSLENLDNKKILNLLESLKKDLENFLNKKIDILLEWNKKNINLMIIFKENNNKTSVDVISETIENNEEGIVTITIKSHSINITNFNKKGYLIYKTYPNLINYLEKNLTKFLSNL